MTTKNQDQPVKQGHIMPHGAVPPTLATLPEPSVGQMLQKLIESGITTESVAALEKLCDLKIKVDAINAEKEFAKAFNELMAEIPVIQATHPVPNKAGVTKYKLAKLDEIDAQLRPLARKFGFTYSFEEGKSDNGKVTKICTVQHVGGHKRSNAFGVRIGAGPPETSESQKDMAAHSFAKRGALCDAFAIMIEQAVEDDGNLIGKPIGKALAEDLEARCKKAGVDIERFLKFAGAANFESIPDNRYDSLNEMLERKERGAGKETEFERKW